MLPGTGVILRDSSLEGSGVQHYVCWGRTISASRQILLKLRMTSK